jgi:hypothetical protein
MIVHALTLTIYLLSLFVWIAVETFAYYGFFAYTLQLLEIFCDRLTEVMICYIFWNMDNIQFVPVPTANKTAEEEVAPEDAIKLELVQSTDLTFSLQLVMWQQFMRVPNSSVHRSLKTSTATAIESQVNPTILNQKKE